MWAGTGDVECVNDTSADKRKASISETHKWHKHPHLGSIFQTSSVSHRVWRDSCDKFPRNHSCCGKVEYSGTNCAGVDGFKQAREAAQKQCPTTLPDEHAVSKSPTAGRTPAPQAAVRSRWPVSLAGRGNGFVPGVRVGMAAQLQPVRPPGTASTTLHRRAQRFSQGAQALGQVGTGLNRAPALGHRATQIPLQADGVQARQAQCVRGQRR